MPYKLAEVAVRAFAGQSELRNHSLDIVGDGPEMDRLREIVAAKGLENIVRFQGRRSQAELADIMRSFDAFVFPSIRELGAGVVVEAMACGMTCIVAEYGAPGHLASKRRGITVPIGPFDDYVANYRWALLNCLANPGNAAEMACAGRDYAHALFTWDRKAEETAIYYRDLLALKPISDNGRYD